MVLTRYFLLLIIFASNTVKILPQWVQTNGPEGGNITCVINNGDNIFAGTTVGGLFVSTNNGTKWTNVKNGLPDGGISALFSSGNIILAGTNNSVYESTDAGSSWFQINDPIPYADIYSFEMLENNIFVGTSRGLFLSDNISTWTLLNSGIPSNASIFTLTRIGNIIFAGTSGGAQGGPEGIYCSTNNGVTWFVSNIGIQYKPDSEIANHNNKIREKTKGSKYILNRNINNKSNLPPLHPSVYTLKVSGSNIFAGTTEGTFISADTGATWKLITDGLIYGEYVYSIAVRGENTFAGTSGGIYLSTNNGILWTEIIEGLPSNSRVNSLLIKDNVIIAGTGGGIYLSTNNGNNWTIGNDGLINILVTALGVKGKYIFAGTFNTSGSEGIYRSSNYGDTWTYNNSGIPDGNWIETIVINGNNIFTGTSSYTGTCGVFLSTDDGLSWTQSGLAGQRIWSIAISGNNIFAGTDSGVYISTDNGKSWSTRNNGIPDGVTILDIAINGDKILAGGSDVYLSPPTEMYLSTNNGLNWKVITDGLPDDALICTIGINGNNIFAGTGYGDGLYLSTNDGSSWTSINNGITGYFIRSVIFKGDTIFASTSPDGVFISTNNGTNWNSFNDGFANTNVDPLVLAEDFLLAGGNGVWRRDISDLSTPVELTTFTATIKGNFIQLNWKTATELNNRGFEIERVLLNKVSNSAKWETLEFVKGAGTSSSESKYSFTDKSINDNGKYRYRLKQIDFSGKFKYSNSTDVNVNLVNLNYALENNFPNPYNPTTVIRYSLPFESNVKLIIYNTLGQTVKVLVSAVQPLGIHEVNFDGSNLSSGTYFYKLNTVSVEGNKNFTATKKMILLK